MTDQHLRDLLHEHVADVAVRDLADDAWEAGLRHRRRGRALATAGVVAAAVATLAGTQMVRGNGDVTPAPVAPTTALPSPTSGTYPGPTTSAYTPGPGPVAQVEGAPVWLGPEVAQETNLPWWSGSVVPATIDLSAAQGEAGAIGPITGAFALSGDEGLRRVVLLPRQGHTRLLDISRLHPVFDSGPNRLSPLTSHSVSPDGGKVFFIQERSLEVLHLDQHVWVSIPLPRYRAETARWIDAETLWVPDQVGRASGPGQRYRINGDRLGAFDLPAEQVWGMSSSAEPYGPAVTGEMGSAQAAFLNDAQVVIDGTHQSWEAVGVRDETGLRALALPYGPFDDSGQGGRMKGCCSMVSWLGGDTVAFASDSTTPRILAWRVGTGEVSLVSTLTGIETGQEWYVASWADLGR